MKNWLRLICCVMTLMSSVAWASTPCGAEVYEVIAHAKRDVSVNLMGLGIDDACMQQLAPKLASLSAMRALYLQQNHLTHQGLVSLVEALITHSDLNTLVLDDNQFSGSKLYALATLVRQMPHLLQLDLAHNNLTASDVAPLLQALQRSTSQLQALNLYGNRLGNQGAKQCMSMITHSPSLQFLHLGDNHIAVAQRSLWSATLADSKVHVVF